jgi:two-component system C4-dicarboxylate transport sensor histidine kinase DctB
MIENYISTELRPRRQLFVFFALAPVVIIFVGIAIELWATNSATGVARIAAIERMRGNAGLFESELQKYRLMPLVLAENSDVIALVQSRQPALAKQLNVKLRLLAQRTGIAAIYVIDSSGTTLAASNFDLPTSFVGENYSYRPYFRQALKGQNAEYFARGEISGQPGLFFAQGVANGRGVVVAKITFEKLEAEWAKQQGPTMIRDRYGVVTVASELSWVLHPTRPIPSRALQEAQQTRQFGTSIPKPLSFTLPAPRTNISAGEELVELAPNRKYAVASTPVPIANWTLSTLEPLQPALESARTRAQVIGLSAILILVIAFGFLVRSRERRRLLIASRQILEEEVKRRTAELRGTNEQLVMEVAERERTSRHLRKARDELAQANRLGSIGQITAGVAHEINQPVAAIRTFAENAKILINNSDFFQTERNLDLIVELTSRIGRITSELRAFARRDAPLIGNVKISDALDGALILIGDRLRAQGVSLKLPDKLTSDVTVLADRVRLEQVIINLLQNSLDALTEVEEPQIEIRMGARPTSKEVILMFDDNGPGVPPALRKTLFKPFVTGKKHGLGLGLGIAQDIAREFGGELTLAKTMLGGTAFSVKLLQP